MFPEWHAKDAVSYFGTAKTHGKLKVKSTNGVEALLEGDGDSLGPYYIIYPYRESNAIKDGKLITSIPAEQKLTDDNIVSGALPAVGVSETQKLEMKTVGALIKLEILDSDITSILIQSTGVRRRHCRNAEGYALQRQRKGQSGRIRRR